MSKNMRFIIKSNEKLKLKDVTMYFKAIDDGIMDAVKKENGNNKFDDEMLPVVESITEGSIILDLILPFAIDVAKEIIVSSIADIIRKNINNLIRFEIKENYTIEIVFRNKTILSIILQ